MRIDEECACAQLSAGACESGDSCVGVGSRVVCLRRRWGDDVKRRQFQPVCEENVVPGAGLVRIWGVTVGGGVGDGAAVEIIEKPREGGLRAVYVVAAGGAVWLGFLGGGVAVGGSD